MKIEVGKSYRTRDGRKATVLMRLPDGLDDRWVGAIGTIVTAWGDDGRWANSGIDLPDDDDILSEWYDPTPFEKALAEWRARYHPEAVTDFFWNAATEHAANALSFVDIGGTRQELTIKRLAEEIRKAKV